MTDDEIRIAVAECLGFFVHYEGSVAYMSRDPKPNWDHRVYQSCSMRDFTSDLNACASFEETLPDDNSLYGRVSYNNHLMRICGSHAACVSAKARQRCEAFLKVKGLWKP